MVFPILPRKAFTIECDLTPDSFHQKMSDTFNTAYSGSGSSILPSFDQSTSYIYSRNEFEISKFFTGRISSPGSSVYGVGQIVSGDKLQARIDYYNDNMYAKTAMIAAYCLFLLFIAAYVFSLLSPQAYAGSPAAPFICLGAVLLTIFLIRFFMIFQINMLHGQVIQALSA